MRVYFIIKANSTEYIHYMDVPPKPDGSERPAKECCAEVKERVRKESGRNAFTPFCCPRSPKDWQIRCMQRATEWDFHVKEKK